MLSNCPTYFISNLSNTKERPEIWNPLYSALHGPAGNEQDMCYYFDKKMRKRVTVCDEVLKYCKKPNVLYLYHGERYCVEKENKTDNANDKLFDDSKDASTVLYPDHKLTYKIYETAVGVKDSLRGLMNTPYAPEEHIKTLFAKDIVSDGVHQ